MPLFCARKAWDWHRNNSAASALSGIFTRTVNLSPDFLFANGAYICMYIARTPIHRRLHVYMEQRRQQNDGQIGTIGWLHADSTRRVCKLILYSSLFFSGGNNILKGNVSSNRWSSAAVGRHPWHNFTSGFQSKGFQVNEIPKAEVGN